MGKMHSRCDVSCTEAGCPSNPKYPSLFSHIANYLITLIFLHLLDFVLLPFFTAFDNFYKHKLQFPEGFHFSLRVVAAALSRRVSLLFAETTS